MENNWNIEQTKELFGIVYSTAARGEGLSLAFKKMSERCNRSVNSVRNYYYSQLKMFELVPNLANDLGIKTVKNQRKQFDFFKNEEIDNLVSTILIEKAKGKSVRATINEMSGGDAKLALRLQNKYRSMIAHHKEKLMALMSEMSSKSVVYYNPYTKQVMDGTSSDNLQKLGEYIGKLDASEVGSFLSIIRKLM